MARERWWLAVLPARLLARGAVLDMALGRARRTRCQGWVCGCAWAMRAYPGVWVASHACRSGRQLQAHLHVPACSPAPRCQHLPSTHPHPSFPLPAFALSCFSRTQCFQQRVCLPTHLWDACMWHEPLASPWAAAAPTPTPPAAPTHVCRPWHALIYHTCLRTSALTCRRHTCCCRHAPGLLPTHTLPCAFPCAQAHMLPCSKLLPLHPTTAPPYPGQPECCHIVAA